MKTPIPPPTGETLDQDSLLFASLILKDVRQLISGIRAIAATLLRYATLGASITDGFMGLMTSDVSESC